MTNAMIVLMESIKLMDAGVIKGSGIKGTTPEGKEVELPEVIHTYQVWKSLGYQVKKGEKAVAQFPIWKFTNGKMKEEQVREDVDVDTNGSKGYCFMKMASFFTKSQVEKMEGKKC